LWYFLRMNKNGKKDNIRLSEYLEQKLKLGSITFTKADAIKSLGCSESAFMRASQRLQKKGQLLRPITGFYVIIEIEHHNAGGPPPIHFIGKLMKYLELPYYVGLLSAAKYHGATHQAVFETQVFTTKPLPAIKYGKNRIRFITNKFTDKIPKEPLKTPHGDILISSPEATVVDLVRYNKKAVGLSHVATVILEMKDKLNSKRLPALAEIHNDTPLTQRVGYMIEGIGKKQVAPLYQWLRKRELKLVKLEPSMKLGTKSNKKWCININVKIEADDI
jgi:predicted transcriptional regulator of viral defense system